MDDYPGPFARCRGRVDPEHDPSLTRSQNIALDPDFLAALARDLQPLIESYGEENRATILRAVEDVFERAKTDTRINLATINFNRLIAALMHQALIRPQRVG